MNKLTNGVCMSALYLYHFSTKDFSRFNLDLKNPLHEALGAGIYTSDIMNFVQGQYDFTREPKSEFVQQKRVSVNHSAFVDAETYALYLQKKFNIEKLDLVQMILSERMDFPKQNKNDFMEKYQYDYVKTKQLKDDNVQSLLTFLYDNSVQKQVVQMPVPRRRVYKCCISDDKGIVDGSKTLKESKIKQIDVADICNVLDINMQDIHRLLIRTEYLINLKKNNDWRVLWDEKRFSPSYQEKVIQRNNVLKKLSSHPHNNDKINQYEQRFKTLKTEVLHLKNMKDKTDKDILVYEKAKTEVYKICEKLISHYFYNVPYGLLHKNFIKTSNQCQKLNRYLGIKGLYAYQTVPNFDKQVPVSERKQAFEKWVVLTDLSDVYIETYMGYDTKGQWKPVNRVPVSVSKNLQQRYKE